MMGHSLSFYGEIWKIIPELSLLPLLKSYLKHCAAYFNATLGDMFSCNHEYMPNNWELFFWRSHRPVLHFSDVIDSHYRNLTL